MFPLCSRCVANARVSTQCLVRCKTPQRCLPALCFNIANTMLHLGLCFLLCCIALRSVISIYVLSMCVLAVRGGAPCQT